MPYRQFTHEQIVSRVGNLLKHQSPRRSRRFKADLELDFIALSEKIFQPGKISEISAHGAIVESPQKEKIFRVGEQLIVRIPISKFFQSAIGEYLKISARIRRVLMGGNKAAVAGNTLQNNSTLY